MKRPARLVLALLTPILLVWSVLAEAQNCTNGNNIFHRKAAGIDISCAQSACHGPDPADNTHNIMTGGQYAGSGTQAGNISDALDRVPDMNGLREGLGLTASDLDDLALYIWYRSIPQACPTAGGTATLSVSPTSLSFGNVTVGTSSPTQSFTVSNTGTATANTLAIGAAPAQFSRSTTCGATLAAGTSCTVTVTFSPTATGSASGSIAVTADVAVGGAPVGVSGTGVAPAAASLSVSPTGLSFGSVNVGTSSATQSFTVSNSGSAGATGLTIGAAPAQFSRTSTCGASLGAGASCTVTVTFSPTGAGAASGSIAVTASVAVSGAPVGVSGTGVVVTAPSLSAAPTSLSFGTVVVGTTSAAQTITVSNTGNADATDMSYPAAPPKYAKTGAGTCGAATLAKNSSCTLVFTYAPTGGTVDNATYTIFGGGGSIPISLSGIGSLPPPAALSVSPTSLPFGSVTVGTSSAAQTVTVTNTGGQNATGLSVGSNNAKFAATNGCGGTLAAGASCSVSVKYTPGVAGSDAASVTVSYTGGNISVPVSGTGILAPTASLGVAPGSLTFGSVTVGTTASAQTVTVSNSGGAQATGLAVSSGSSKFALTSNTCGATLNAGASCAFAVAYTPTGAGSDAATVTVSYTGGSSLAVAVSGSGTAAPAASLGASPPTVAFGSVTVGQTSSTTTITVTNSGNAAASGVNFVNGNPSRFPVTANTCGATINAGASCTFAVAYAPAAAGNDTGTATFTYGGGGALSVSFTGTGVAVPPPPGTGKLSFGSALGFPDTTVGTSSAGLTVAVTNTGSATVTVTGVTSNSGEFTVGANTCASVAAGAACSFSVTFTPAAAGGRSGVVTVTSSGAGSPQLLAVNGTGVAVGGGPPSAVNLNQHGLTGSWYQPSTSGQGFEIEIFPDAAAPGAGVAQVSWFTFDTVAGGAERQRWYTLAGQVTAGQPAALTIYQNVGGNFNAPPITTAQPVGTATLSFDSCANGQLAYSFADGSARTGNIPIVRLTQNMTCAPAGSTTPNADFALSGNWFDPATSGQGITVEVNAKSATLFLAWYTYAPNGVGAGAAGQRWYTGQGAYTAGTRSIPVLFYETTGGVFDASSPSPATVQVGSGTIAFQNCGSATLSYTFTGGSSSGSAGTINLSRVGPVPAGCN